MNVPLYVAARLLCRLVVSVAFGFRALGCENVPGSGAVIIACNHVSYLDPVALGIALPRPVTYIAKKELFAIPLFGRLIAALGAYPIDRAAGGVSAVRAALRVLRAGQCIGIFPEGTRNFRGTASEKGGAALLAALSGAPVVPAAIVGTYPIRPFRQVRVRYGKPLRIERTRQADGDDLEKWTAEIMRRIRALEESIVDH